MSARIKNLSEYVATPGDRMIFPESMRPAIEHMVGCVLAEGQQVQAGSVRLEWSGKVPGDSVYVLNEQRVRWQFSEQRYPAELARRRP